MKPIVIAMVAVAALFGVAPASAHLVTHRTGHKLSQIEASQKQNLAHAKYVCHHGANQHKRWSCHAIQWLTRELNETEAALHPPRVTVVGYMGYRGLSRIRYANPYCESGGDPYNKHNPKYRGKWQFDQGTWDAHADRKWRGHDPATVPESVQDQTALRVRYDAWPNC